MGEFTFMTSCFSLRWPFNEDELKSGKKSVHSWSIGEKVMAVYYEDGLNYRAKILQLKDWKSAAIVRFSDYGNEEEVKLSDMIKIDKKPSKVHQ